MTIIFHEGDNKKIHIKLFIVQLTLVIIVSNQNYLEGRTFLPINVEKMGSLLPKSQCVTLEMLQFIPKEW